MIDRKVSIRKNGLARSRRARTTETEVGEAPDDEENNNFVAGL